MAFARIKLLPPRQAQFTRGFVAYLAGQADSAVRWLKRALATAPHRTEAHMLLGEVYYHLLPTDSGPLEPLAAEELRAAASDSGFAPPLYHLAEIAIRGGNVAAAEKAVRDFERLGGSNPRAMKQLSLMLSCISRGRGAVDWRRTARTSPLEVVVAAKTLAAAAAAPACAEDGFRAVLPDTVLSWGAVLGLQGVLAAQGRITELALLIDSVTNSFTPDKRVVALRLYVLDAIAGVPLDSHAAAAARLVTSPTGSRLDRTSAWLIGSWSATHGWIDRVEEIHRRLASEAATTSDPLTTRLAIALAGRLALLKGDTATAMKLLASVLSEGRRDALEWDLAEPLPGERLLLAQLLLVRGHAEEAAQVASVFDHPGPIAFFPFLPASLRLRLQAAEAQRDTRAAAHFRDRLSRLGLDDQTIAFAPNVQGELP
jgi:hypothetical protein